MDLCFLGCPKLWDQLKEQFHNGDISKELFHALTHKAGVNKHHVHKFSVFFTSSQRNHKQAEEKLQNHKLLDICCTKGSKCHPNILALPTQPEVWTEGISETPGLEDTPIYRRILFPERAKCQQGQGSLPSSHTNRLQKVLGFFCVVDLFC